MHAHDMIARLADTASRTEKEAILHDAFLAGHREFFIAARVALNPLVPFYITKATLFEDENDDTVGTFTFNDLLDLVGKLSRRELTGHAARDAIAAAAEASNAKVWNGFYRRVLLKDFKAGFDSNTVNKVLKKIGGEANEYLVPIFGCQLAHDGADAKHAKKLETGTWLLDRKLDGVRLLTVLDIEKKTVTQYTRNGKVNENFTEITTAFARLLPKLTRSVVFDGEIVAGSFQELMTQVNRRSSKDTASARLALFDVVPLADFQAGLCTMTQDERHALLTGFQTSGTLAEAVGELAYVLPKIKADLGTPEGQDLFVQFNRETVEAGFEGIMCKRPDAFYITKRSDDWLKVKPFIEVSLEVVAVEEGKAEGKYKGMMGALVCRGEDDGRLIETNVGSGFSDAQRVDFWERRDEIVGMIAEVRADALTLERGETVYSLRFPRFKGFRGTVPGEKL